MKTYNGRGQLNHACPINCPPKTCLKDGESGNVNPRNISTFQKTENDEQK